MGLDVRREPLHQVVVKTAFLNHPQVLLIVSSLVEVEIIEPAEVKQLISLPKRLPAWVIRFLVALLPQFEPTTLVPGENVDCLLVVSQQIRWPQTLDRV